MLARVLQARAKRSEANLPTPVPLTVPPDLVSLPALPTHLDSPATPTADPSPLANPGPPADPSPQDSGILDPAPDSGLSLRVAALEAQVSTLTQERDTLLQERSALILLVQTLRGVGALDGLP